MIAKHAYYFTKFDSMPEPAAVARAEEHVAQAGADLMYYDGPLPKVLEGHPLHGKNIVEGEWPHWKSCLEYRKPELVESPYNIKWVPPAKVSVVITCYDNPDMLRVTLPLWKEQTYPNFEVLVVDDGSPEEAAAQIKELVDNLGYRYYYNDSGDVYSIASARNVGVWHAEGERIIFTDSDMIPDPEFIFEHMTEASNSNITVGCRYHFDAEDLSDINSTNIAITSKDSRMDGAFKSIEKGTCLDPWESCHGCNLSIHRSQLISINGFDEEYDGNWGAEDVDLSYRLIRKGLKVVPVPKSIGYHIDHPSREKEGQRALLVRKMREDVVRDRPKSWNEEE